jgi:hypothetical protein
MMDANLLKDDDFTERTTVQRNEIRTGTPCRQEEYKKKKTNGANAMVVVVGNRETTAVCDADIGVGARFYEY